MGEIAQGVVYGLVAEIIVMLIVIVIAKVKNSSLFMIFAASKIFGHGIEYVYKEQRDASKDILKDIESSTTVKLLCMRGRSFIQTDAELSQILEKRNLTIQYLVLDPDSQFVQKRADELNKQNYKQELETNISDLKTQTQGKANVAKRIHDQPPVFRLLILDNRIYFSFFEKNKLGSQLPVFRAKDSSPIYKGLVRYYEYIWGISKKLV